MMNPWIGQGRPLPSQHGHRKSEYQDKDNIIRSQSQLSAISLDPQDYLFAVNLPFQWTVAWIISSRRASKKFSLFELCSPVCLLPETVNLTTL